MKVLITGGAGFVGSALIRHLICHSQVQVVNYDHLSYAGNLQSLASVSESSRYHFVRGDICDQKHFAQTLKLHQPDAIMHLAAESHVDRSIDDADAFVQTNLVGTYQVLKASRAFFESLASEQAEKFRFLHISTDEVFGDLSDSGGLFTEDSRYQPSSPYSATKAGADHLVRAWGKTYGLPILVTHCSNNYGPYQFPEKLIPHMILSALAQQPLPIYGDGRQIRDWLYVDDHAKALWEVVQRGAVGETYNIGSRSEMANIDVVRRICVMLREIQNVDIDYERLLTFVTDRPGHDIRYAIDATKMQQGLNWMPKEDFESGLRKTIQWYLKNTGWWESVLDGSYRLARVGQK